MPRITAQRSVVLSVIERRAARGLTTYTTNITHLI